MTGNNLKKENNMMKTKFSPNRQAYRKERALAWEVFLRAKKLAEKIYQKRMTLALDRYHKAVRRSKAS